MLRLPICDLTLRMHLAEREIQSKYRLFQIEFFTIISTIIFRID